MVLWIVANDQPFTVVESPEFQLLINLCNSIAKLPSADTVKKDILKLFKNNQKNIQNLLQVSIFSFNNLFIYL